MKRSEIEQAKAELLKAARAYVRLKHALAADRELNDLLPKLEAEFNRRVATGKPYKALLESVFRG